MGIGDRRGIRESSLCLLFGGYVLIYSYGTQVVNRRAGSMRRSAKVGRQMDIRRDGRMDGWKDRWIYDFWIDRQMMDGWTDIQISGWGEQTIGYTDGRTDGHTNIRVMDDWMDGRMDGWRKEGTDGWNH